MFWVRHLNSMQVFCSCKRPVSLDVFDQDSRDDSRRVECVLRPFYINVKMRSGRINNKSSQLTSLRKESLRVGFH